MKTIGLVLVLAMATSGAAMADVATIDVYAGYNYVGPPSVPFDPAPEAVFVGGALDISGAPLLKWASPEQIAEKLRQKISYKTGLE